MTSYLTFWKKMMKKVILVFTAFVLAVQCTSVPRINNDELEIDIALLLKELEEIKDPCEDDPCQNGGVCVEIEKEVKCICNSPYFGKTCSEDHCTPNPCYNDGKCELEREGFKCACKSPFRGETCKLDPCSPNPCENEGKCELIGDSFNCTCKNPYRGDTCELGPCVPNPCRNGGECEEDGESFKCNCKSPFQGETCEKSPCSPNPCENNGRCYLTEEASFTCLCEEPFSGERCEKGPCKPNPCQNDGKCAIFGNDTRCFCQSAYFGKFCEKDLCSKMPCKNGGKCTIERNKVKCQCESPFTGEKCEKDLCTSNPCKNDGICKLDGNSFKCECRPPYKGKRCENGPCFSYPCLNNGGCKVDENTFSCKCVPPYEGKHCESGPCSSNPCLNNAGCRVIDLTFRCDCKPPYKGNQCEMRDSTEPDISMTTYNVSIKTTNITYPSIPEITDSYNWTSSEPSVFTSEENVTTMTDRNSTNGIMSTTIEQANPKASPKGICETDSDCLNGGTCRKVREDEHICECTENFGGIRCEVNLPCVGLDQSCRIINAVCVIIDNHAICECPNGTLYHRKSGLCEDICDPRKCLHGKCEIIGKTYKCNCDQGYTGNHCDEKERGNHENFVPWFTVIASINLFVCVLLIGMFCVICQMKRIISSV